MTEKIGRPRLPGLEVGTTKPRSTTSVGQQTGAQPTSIVADSRNAVELTDMAARLKAIEARLKELPDVDQARVDTLRQQIESGEYEIKPDQIAEQLLRLEQAFM